MLIGEEAKKNHLLASLSVPEFDRVRPSLELVSLRAGLVLYAWGDEIDYVYFPTTAVIALIYPVETGMTIEVGMIGSEGILGIEIFLGGESAPSTAIVQNAGFAYRMSSGTFRANCAGASMCRGPLLRYTHDLISQISHAAVCNRFHTIHQRYARWLLESGDRVDANRLSTTHQEVADLLGVRRESITMAAHELSVSGAIKVNRGSVTIVDRPGLAFAACECYKVVSTEDRSRAIGRYGKIFEH